MLTLKGRTCVFAGATGEIGRGAVLAMAEGGMNVVMVTHNPAGAAAIMEEMRDLPGAVIAMSNEDSNEVLYERIAEKFGSVDVVISTTGILHAPASPDTVTDAFLDDKLHHQVTEAYNMVRAALPYLRKSRAGRVIFTSSAGAMNGFEGENIADSIARGAVVSMTYALSKALMKDGITVNCIARSGMINDHPVKDPGHILDVETIRGQIPAGIPGSRDAYGAMASYIASEEASFVTGHIFNLTGGLYVG